MTAVRLAHPVFSLSREQRRDGRPPIFFSGVLNTQNSDNTVCSTTCRYSILIIQIVDYIFYINIYSKNEQEKIIIITLKVLAFLRAFSQVAVSAPCLLICQIYYLLNHHTAGSRIIAGEPTIGYTTYSTIPLPTPSVVPNSPLMHIVDRCSYHMHKLCPYP